jgi:hypothetical protein
VLGLYPVAGFIMVYVGLANALNGWQLSSRPAAGSPSREQVSVKGDITTT